RSGRRRGRRARAPRRARSRSVPGASGRRGGGARLFARPKRLERPARVFGARRARGGGDPRPAVEEGRRSVDGGPDVRAVAPPSGGRRREPWGPGPGPHRAADGRATADEPARRESAATRSAGSRRVAIVAVVAIRGATTRDASIRAAPGRGAATR